MAQPESEQPMEAHARFTADMEAAGYEVAPYKGRYFYQGPAVRIDREELQAVIRATTVRLQSDALGRRLVVYPGEQ